LARPANGAGSWFQKRLVVDLLGLVALTGAVALLWARGRPTWYWLDEGISVGISSHSMASIPALLRQDGSPPLYYLLLHVWMVAFGTSEVQTHLLSLILALATIPAALWAGWSLFGRRTGWTCAVLAAVSPYIAQQANETRMYSLVVLLSLVSTACFLHVFVYRHRRHLPAFAASLVLLCYSHNWGLFFGAGVAVAVALCVALGTDRRGLLLDAALASVVVAVLYAPWVPTLLSQLAHTGLPSAPAPTLEGAREDLVRLIGGREVVVVLGLGAGAPLFHMLRRPWGRRGLAVMATATIAIVTIALAWIVSTRSPVWVFRYLGVALPPVLVLGALGLGRAGRLGMAALALIAFLAAPVADRGPLDQKSNMRDLAMKVAPRLLPGDLVIAPTGEVPLLAFYLPKGPRFSTTSGPVRDARVADWRDATERLRDNDPRVVLAPGIDGVAPGGHVLVVCPQTGAQATEFGRLNAQRCDDTLALVRSDPRFSSEMVVTPPADVRVSPVEGDLLTRRA
jgi:hypothetical protein